MLELNYHTTTQETRSSEVQYFIQTNIANAQIDRKLSRFYFSVLRGRGKIALGSELPISSFFCLLFSIQFLAMHSFSKQAFITITLSSLLVMKNLRGTHYSFLSHLGDLIRGQKLSDYIIPMLFYHPAMSAFISIQNKRIFLM